ncbi:hypothetical protein EP7_001500 [Isosphaeraceae bacterium EP7]
MRRTLTAIAVLFGLPLSVAACLWDRDTPADEARGMPEVVAVLTGRFERNPPLFYEMRLARVSAHLRDLPQDLAGYDDAGVACDRLGRGEEAVEWMEKKRAQLETLDASLPAVKEHWYRLHANLGTFLVHGWARQGADRSKISEVKAARDEIVRALEINPNAHFGREKSQLLALTWIVDPPKLGDSQVLPNLLGWQAHDFNGTNTAPQMADDAVRGLAGLIVLGNAWESVDIFNALNQALQRDSQGFARNEEGGRNTLAYLAWLRCCELVDAGRGSMLPDAPKGQALKAILPRPDFLKSVGILEDSYLQLRTEADAWQAARAEFMTSRLNAGHHPDTEPGFWEGYVERPAPLLPTQSVPDAYNALSEWRRWWSTVALIGVPLVSIALIFGLPAVRRAKTRRLKAAGMNRIGAESGDEPR